MGRQLEANGMNMSHLELNLFNFEAIVLIPYSLMYLIEQAGGLKSRSAGYMGNSYMKRANLTASHGSRGLREYRQQDVSNLAGCFNRILRP